jgi:hypothetical protein
MIFTAEERAGFARHENEQRRQEAAMPFPARLAMLAQMQRMAVLFGHGCKPDWAEAVNGDRLPQLNRQLR